MTIHVAIPDELIETRHFLHAHPERSFAEYKTSQYVSQLLNDHGIDVLDNSMETGVCAQIDGDHDGPLIGLRADIDGLPIEEASGLPFSSLNAGVMHGCGHDIHMSSLLGAAYWLNTHRELIHGNIRLIFQPAEELGAGARAVIDAGLVDGVAAMIGTHNNPNYAPGVIAAGTEPMMAGCVKFQVTLHAQGTHAGYPHKGSGPLEAMAAMVMSLQTIVSRNASPFHPLVVSVTQMSGGDVWNVVPAQAMLQGTVRYFYREDGDLARRRFYDIVQHTAAAYNIDADIMWDDFQEPLVSDPTLIRAVDEGIAQYATLAPIQPSMAGEDFAEYAHIAPLVFAFIGSNGAPDCADWHSPHFIALDESIQTGADFYANAALTVLAQLQ